MEINKCPVCKTAKLHWRLSRFSDRMKMWYVSCECGLTVGQGVYWDTKEHAVKAWNREVPGNEPA